MIYLKIDAPAGPAVGQYVGEDTSDQALGAFVVKACGPYTWQRITSDEANAIRDARPKPQPALGPELPANASADLHAALGVLVEAVENLNAKNKALEAKLEAVIDATVLTDVVEG